MNDTVKRALAALEAIGAVRRVPPPPRASRAQKNDPFSTHAWAVTVRDSDPYWCKVMGAWRQIATYQHLAGAMRWAEKHHAALYRRVTSELPAAWEKLWDEGAPLDEFQVALDRWVQAHEELIGLFPITRGTK